MHCYVCFESIHSKTTWGHLFQLFNRKICLRCEKHFEKLQAEHACLKCMKPIEYHDGQMCDDCLAWKKRLNEDPLERNVSIFKYNDFLKEVMSKFKYRGDYEMVYVFEKDLQKAYVENFQNMPLTITPIPLSKERYEERGFNQAEAIAKQLNKPIVNLLTRTHTEKQAKRTKRERVFSENPFQALEVKEGMNILLIDDFYTTGTTLRQAAIELKSKGANKIYALTLIRS